MRDELIKNILQVINPLDENQLEYLLRLIENIFGS